MKCAWIVCLFSLLTAGGAQADERTQPWDLRDAQVMATVSGVGMEARIGQDEAGNPAALAVTFLPGIDWPHAALPLAAPQDWSAYSYLSINTFNAQPQDVTITFEIRDAAKKMYKPARKLPAGQWREFRLPISKMALGSDSGWCGDPVDVKQITGLAFVANKPKERCSVRFARIALVRVTPLPSPKLLATGKRDGVSLSWNAVPGAVTYEIYREEPGGEFTRLARFPLPRFVDTSARAGQRYAYQVAALNEMLTAGERSPVATAGRTTGGRAALPPAGRFGGRADIKLKATGFFHTEKTAKRWVLVDPEGHPFFSLGLDVIGLGDTFTRVSRRESQFQEVLAEKDAPQFKAAWTPLYGYAPYGLDEKGLVFSRYVRSQIRKYGAGWQSAWRRNACDRLTAWHINTFGAWCDGETVQQGRRPYVTFGGSWGACPRVPGARVPDVFDPAFAKNVEEAAAKAAAQKADPYLIGRFTDNELEWHGDWQHGKGIADLIQGAPAALAAKKAWVDFLRERYPEVGQLNAAWKTQFTSVDDLLSWTEKVPDQPAAQADKSAFLEAFADRYFRVTTEALHRHDPNHLVLGARHAGSAPEEVIRANGRHSDIVSLNLYEMLPGSERFLRHADLTGKPWLIGEFSFRGQDCGLPNHAGAGFRVPTQVKRGEAYQNYLAEALAIPNLVGIHWFQYIDEPATGRFDGGKDGGEDSNYGWVNAEDQPYQEFTERAALINANAPLALP